MNRLQKWLRNTVSSWAYRRSYRTECRTWFWRLTPWNVLLLPASKQLSGGKKGFAYLNTAWQMALWNCALWWQRVRFLTKPLPRCPWRGVLSKTQIRLKFRIGGLARWAAVWHPRGTFSPGSCGVTYWSSGPEVTQLIPLTPVYAWHIKVGHLFRSFCYK